MKFKSVIFDLDGTLLDSLPDIAESMNRVLEELGYPTHPVDSYRYYVGEGIRELVKQAIPKEKFEHYSARVGDGDGFDLLVKKYRAIYDVQWRKQSVPYRGIPEMLNALMERNIKIGILSNKLDDFTRQMVVELLPSWKFDVVLGSRPGIPLKPAPDSPLEIAKRMGTHPGEMAFIGDSGIDMQTAVNSKMNGIGVLWGFREKEELIKSGATYLIDHPMQLIELL